MLESFLKEYIVLLGWVWLIIFVINCFILRKLNCLWCKKWCWVGGCLDMLGGGLVDILFLFVYNLCLLFLLENLEKKWYVIFYFEYE